MHIRLSGLSLVLMLSLALAACGATPAAQPAPTVQPTVASAPAVLRLATTTSTADSGLLDAILPSFQAAYGARVEVIAVGTGQALELGTNGDVDVVLVHARASEDAFVAAGHGLARRDVMYNDFVIVGPTDDPAAIGGLTSAADALQAIAAAEATFASRGDNSGTHQKELALWATAAFTPTQDLTWYKSLGQGMGETLLAANELAAYTLTDRSTWLALSETLPELQILFGGSTIDANPDQALYNPYGVIPVNPAKHEGINAELADQFALWLTSPETQAAIATYGTDRFVQALFYPNATP